MRDDELEELARQADAAAVDPIATATDEDWAWLTEGLGSAVDLAELCKNATLKNMELKEKLNELTSTLSSTLVRAGAQSHLEKENERLRMELAPTGPPEAFKEAQEWKAKYVAMRELAKGMEREMTALRQALRSERLERENVLALDGGRTVDAGGGTHGRVNGAGPGALTGQKKPPVIIETTAEVKPKEDDDE